jgi:Family of unknown function (DUF6544)
MRRAGRVVLVLVAAVVVVGLVVHLTARRLFVMEVDATVEAVSAVAPTPVDREGLPPLVRAFAERAVAGRPALPAAVSFDQAAEMRLKPDAGWTPVSAHQTVGIGAPAFVWDARARMAQLIGVRVIDAYVGGTGRLTVRLLGSIPISEATGPEVSRGELFRYLAELPWSPYAMLGNPALRWREVDDSTVEVSAATADGQTASVRLVFDEAGDIIAVEADDRPRESEGRFLATSWRGDFSDYKDFGGVRLPARADVAWMLETGPYVYFRGDVLSYDVAAPD